MPFALNEFRNTLQHGGARPSQFDMDLVWPANISQMSARLKMPFLCQISEIPGATLGTVTVPYFGRELYYAGDRKFEPLTITVINDEDFLIRHALEEWMKAITAHSFTTSQYQGNIASARGASTSYATRAQVRQLSRNENGNGPQQRYVFEGIFPVALGNIDLNWEAYDQIERFTCQFRYQWWECDTFQRGSW